jgi:hypothetical protein
MSTVEKLRPELTPMPDRIKRLPVDARGYPVPWFVDWLDGVPEFRAFDPAKWKRAVKERLCYVCGQRLGAYLTFVVGPMCGINRTTTEPPDHYECAIWAARNCPFLTRPHAHRREDGVMLDAKSLGGSSIKRNPGVVLLWVTRSYEIWRPAKDELLIEIGDPVRVEWYAEGRAATRAEVEESVRTGLPLLEEIARTQQGAMEVLHRQAKEFEALLPEDIGSTR